MAEICCGVVSESKEKSSRTARRRRMEIRRMNFAAGEAAEAEADEDGNKRQRKELYDVVGNCFSSGEEQARFGSNIKESSVLDLEEYPKFGAASVCGRRRDMEDAVAIHPSFCGGGDEDQSTGFHYFGVYDGHGCSHVAMRCRDRLHQLVKEELENKVSMETEWIKKAMDRSFNRMDKEVVVCTTEGAVGARCRCELRAPDSDAVGSTAVVALVSPEKIILANCGDSRAVLCRNGKAFPLSIDHKPDRPDELERIHAAGGRVIYWDGARVLGVLAMSRAIGDNYLKPYVSCEPEVTITDRMAEDECLILASDGLWDVVSNETACGVARMCLKGKGPAASMQLGSDAGIESSDQACSDAAILLTKLALARHSSDNVSVIVIDLRPKSERESFLSLKHWSNPTRCNL